SLFLVLCTLFVVLGPAAGRRKYKVQRTKYKDSGTRCLLTASKPASSYRDPNGTGNLRRKSMLNNLIESTSHAQEFKRRGSLVLFTTAVYALLFVVIGVISIYAYDAHLETQT